MAEKANKVKNDPAKIKEPSILIRPITKLGGLDNIHVALLSLVIILIILLLLVSYYNPHIGPQSSSQTTTAGSQVNYTNYTIHTPAQIQVIAEKMLASYAYSNSSLSVLPYLVNVSAMTVSYVPDIKDWYVEAPFISPGTNTTVYLSAVISDTSGELVTPFIQVASPPVKTDNQVVSPGVVALAGKPYCTVPNPPTVSVAWFIDPYAPGSVQSLKNITSLESAYGGKVNITVKVLYSGAYQYIANQEGAANAQALGKYILCSENQPSFSKFVLALNSLYDEAYLSPNELQNISTTAGVNQTELNSCMTNINSVINAQALLSQYYNITSTPAVVVNCEYQAIPQTAKEAICYSNSTICG